MLWPEPLKVTVLVPGLNVAELVQFFPTVMFKLLALKVPEVLEKLLLMLMTLVTNWTVPAALWVRL